MEKRKRSTSKEETFSATKMEKSKKMKLSPTSKNSKLPIINTTNESLTTQKVHTPESIIKSKNSTAALEIVQTLSTNQYILSNENFGPTSFEEMLNMINNDENNGKLKSSMNLLMNAPMLLEHTIEGVGNNADDIHVTCEGFPMQNLLEPLEKSESSTSKLKKDESDSKLMIVQNGTSEANVPTNLKKTKTNLAKEQKVASKATQNMKGKNSSKISSNNTLKKPTTRKSAKSGIASRLQNKNKKDKDVKTEGENSITLNSHDDQRNGKECDTNEQEPQESHLIALQSTIFDETLKDVNPLNVESIESLPTYRGDEDASLQTLDATQMQMSELEFEVSLNSIYNN